MPITHVETDVIRLPLPRPVALPASQDPRHAKTVDVVIAKIISNNQPVGLGFTYALGGGGEALRNLIDTFYAPLLKGEDALRNERLFARATAEMQGLGFAGLAARAYAAIDFALWDAKGKAANLPVHQLLGGYRTKLKAIAADVATPAQGLKAAAKDIAKALDKGAAGVLVEIGTEDPDVDADRVRQLREAVPEGAWFEISGCGRYDYASALWLGLMFEDEFSADGFADPTAPADTASLKRLCDNLTVGVSAGSLFDTPADFTRAMALGGPSTYRIDAFRLGGLTPARKVAIAAELHHAAICPVRVAQVGAHLAASSTLGRVVETVDWFDDLFEGGPEFVDGQMLAPLGPGLGFTLNETLAAKHRV